MKRFSVLIHRPDDTEEQIELASLEALAALIISVNGQIEVHDRVSGRQFLVEVTG